MIRQELKALGVEIQDKTKVWRASDGRQGPVPAWDSIGTMGAPPAPVPAPYHGRQMQSFATLTLPDGMQLRIEGPMLNRVMAMLQAPQQPIVGRAAYGMPPPPPTQALPRSNATGNLSNPSAAEAVNYITSCSRQRKGMSNDDIQWLVQTRESLRKGKDFASADMVRDAMRSQLGIEIHEKEKRWEASDGRQGQIPMWDDC